MKILAGGAALSGILLTAAMAAAQDRSHLLTQPTLPSQEALDRLNLKLAWHATIPVEGRQDGLASFQMTGKDLFLQTRSGLVLRLDAETGQIRWRTRVGLPYQVPLYVAHNRRLVLVVNSTFLYALDRESGQTLWQFSVPGGISAPPLADEEKVYLCTVTGRFYAYFLPWRKSPFAEKPKPTVPTSTSGYGSLVLSNSATPPSGSAVKGSAGERPSPLSGRTQVPFDLGRNIRRNERANSGPLYAGRTQAPFDVTGPVRRRHLSGDPGRQPIPSWNVRTHLRLGLVPVLTRQDALVVGIEGKAAAYSKAPREHNTQAELYRFNMEGEVLVPPGQFGGRAYIGSRDANLYALDIETGRLDWRYTAGTPISDRPIATEKDVFVVAENNGMARLDRATGQSLWRVPRGNRVLESNPDAVHFLAANPRFVYALDRAGRLLLLDYRRGTTLSTYDARDFVFPITNEATDRLFLAGNNGLLVCLHDRQYDTPYHHRLKEDEAEQALRKKLAQLVSEKANPLLQVRELLDQFHTRYNLKFEVLDHAFVQIGNPEVRGKPVKIPESKMVPLGDLLHRLLAQAGATYLIDGDTLLIYPLEEEPK